MKQDQAIRPEGPLTAHSDLRNNHFCKRTKVARVAKEVGLTNRELLRDCAQLFRGSRESSQVGRTATVLSVFHLLQQHFRQKVQFAIVKIQAQTLGHNRPEEFDIRALQDRRHQALSEILPVPILLRGTCGDPVPARDSHTASGSCQPDRKMTSICASKVAMASMKLCEAP